jgi:hypothetical protein
MIHRRSCVIRNERRRKGRSRGGRVLDLIRVEFIFMRIEIMVSAIMGKRTALFIHPVLLSGALLVGTLLSA